MFKFVVAELTLEDDVNVSDVRLMALTVRLSG